MRWRSTTTPLITGAACALACLAGTALAQPTAAGTASRRSMSAVIARDQPRDGRPEPPAPSDLRVTPAPAG